MKLSNTSNLAITYLAAVVMVTACGADAASEATSPDLDTASLALNANNNGKHLGPGFAIWSPSFKSGEALPYEFTCEGQPFGLGSSPQLHLGRPPEGTHSYALVFKDLTIAENRRGDPANIANRGYHWALWNVSVDTHVLSASLPVGQFPLGDSAEQLSARGATNPLLLSYFGPCPAWESLCNGTPPVTDDYSFTLYAMAAPLVTPTFDPTATDASGVAKSRVRQYDEFFAANSIAQTEILATSDAIPSSFALCPNAPPYQR